MFIDKQYRKGTTFLYVEETNSAGEVYRRPCGTAFFVGVDYSPSKIMWYAVTARHVITQSYAKGILYLRISLDNDNYTDLPLPHDDWFQHHDTDVALIPFSVPHNADIKALPVDHLATDQFIEEKQVTEGDEVFFIGLFVQHSGISKPLPIIRFGNISLMPYEPVRITPEQGTDPISVEAYLVEARSWGGQSGSPTFVHFPATRYPGVIYLPEWPLKKPFYTLLGLVSGHFDISRNIGIGETKEETMKVDHNSGIGVIIPAKYILEMLEWEEVKEGGEKLLSELDNEDS